MEWEQRVRAALDHFGPDLVRKGARAFAHSPRLMLCGCFVGEMVGHSWALGLNDPGWFLRQARNLMDTPYGSILSDAYEYNNANFQAIVTAWLAEHGEAVEPKMVLEAVAV